MNLAQAAVGELVALVGYALLCAAVYKLFQIGSELREIKELLQKGARNPGGDAAVVRVDSDPADQYAQALLRNVHTQPHTGNEPAKSA